MDSPLFDLILSFILMLYADPQLARNVVDKIIQFFHYFLKYVFMRNLERDVLYIIEDSQDKHEQKTRIKSLFNNYSNVYHPFMNETNRINLLKFKHAYKDPLEFEVQSKWYEKMINNELIFNQEPVKWIKIPLDFSLKLFLENRDILDKILAYKSKLCKIKVISNIVQGLWWRSLPNLSDNTLPLYIFCDDIEAGNALGSRGGVNKFTAIYVKIGCLPPNISSRLDSIIFSRLIRVSDKKRINKETVFQDIIEELKTLQKDGIIVNISTGPVKVKFQLALVLGDNLGLNELCGFVESFNANVYCRICSATSKECSKLCFEDKTKMRTVRNYEEHLKAKDEHSTGVKTECIFNNIPNFHIAQNRTLDFMHDFWEGVCKYVMQFILYHFIYEKKYFDLETLNNRSKYFAYNRKDSNKPPLIRKHVTKQKISVKMSASEMSSFVRYFGLMVGDFVHKSNKYWRLYILLRKISDILQSPRFTLSHLEDLRIYVHNLISLYLELGAKLKPKFHFLTHYATIMECFGPCINFDSSRYESRHRLLKANFVATASRRNPMKTIAIKQMMYLCNSCTNSKNIAEIPFSEENDSDEESEAFNIKLHAVGDFIVVNSENDEIEFGEIIEIKHDLEDKILVLQMYSEIFFDEHLYSYVIEKIENVTEIRASDIPHSCNTLTFITKNNVHLLTSKYMI